MRKASLILAVIAVLAALWWLRTGEQPTPTRGPDASPRLSELLSDQGLEGYARALEPRAFAFPGDHGPHPEFRNEWWYFTGNLEDPGGRRFGYELTFFRFALKPMDSAGGTLSSKWVTRQVYIAHFAVTDVAAREFHVDQRYAREALGLSGAETRPLRLWLENWSITHGGGADGRWRLRAAGAGMALELQLTPIKPPILNGDRGLSRKADLPGYASYYYSVPRLATAGNLRIGDRRYPVEGLSWLDREWGSNALAAEQQGWDWFALQLSDGSDLMFYNLRRRDGSGDPNSSGTWIRADGQYEHLAAEDVLVEVIETWESPMGGTYPAGWRITLPARQLDLEVTPVLANQELITNVRYWEGAVAVAGSRAGKEILGQGYVELTGYD